MKYSTRLSDAVYILAFTTLNPNDSLSSNSILNSYSQISNVCANSI